MNDVVIPENLKDAVTTTFMHPCKWCGASIQVVQSQEQPHQCRIEVS